jgi:20S proteasome alpha/beta subunit
MACRLVSSSNIDGGTAKGEFPLTPISNWQESWTASQAQSTAVAMVVQDCVVILLRSPPNNVYQPALPMDENKVQVHGLQLQRIGDSSSSCPMVQYAPSWFPVGGQSLCAMTGLAMDVEHLTRVLQKYVDDELIIFDRPSTTFSMMQMLSKVLRDVCMLKDTRPYGVQAMFIGCDDIDPQRKDGLCMYSIDPSGTWQSWGKATAIGKYGREMRRNLGRKLRSMSLSSMSIPQAIENLVDCWREVCKQQNVNFNNNDDWDIVILQKDPHNKSKRYVYTVSKTEISKFLDKEREKDGA